MTLTSKELKELNSKINVCIEPSHANAFPSWVRHPLSFQEWDQLKESIPNFVMEMHNTGFGFSLGFSLYEAPIYPYLPPTYLMTVDQKQILIPELQKATGGNPQAAFDVFYPLASTPKNIQALKFCKLQLPKTLSYYCY